MILLFKNHVSLESWPVNVASYCSLAWTSWKNNLTTGWYWFFNIFWTLCIENRLDYVFASDIVGTSLYTRRVNTGWFQRLVSRWNAVHIFISFYKFYYCNGSELLLLSLRCFPSIVCLALHFAICSISAANIGHPVRPWSCTTWFGHVAVPTLILFRGKTTARRNANSHQEPFLDLFAWWIMSHTL